MSKVGRIMIGQTLLNIVPRFLRVGLLGVDTDLVDGATRGSARFHNLVTPEREQDSVPFRSSTLAVSDGLLDFSTKPGLFRGMQFYMT